MSSVKIAPRYSDLRITGRYLTTGLPMLFRAHPIWNIMAMMQFSRMEATLYISRGTYNRILNQARYLGLLSLFELRGKNEPNLLFKVETELIRGLCAYCEIKSITIPLSKQGVPLLIKDREMIHVGYQLFYLTKPIYTLINNLSHHSGWVSLKELGFTNYQSLKTYRSKIDKLIENHISIAPLILEFEYQKDGIYCRLPYAKIIISPIILKTNPLISRDNHILGKTLGRLPKLEEIRSMGIAFRVS